jgi:hypothetical protein
MKLHQFATGVVFGLTMILSVAAADDYQVILFASQDPANKTQLSHTFATFVRTTVDENGKQKIEQKTISWLPADYMKTLTLKPTWSVEGRNYTLGETFRAIKALNEKLAKSENPTKVDWKAYGPHQITKENFEKALSRIKALESGSINYHMIDLKTRGREKGEAVNCIHAVSDILPGLNTGVKRGRDATEMVRDYFIEQGYLPQAAGDSSLIDAVVKQATPEGIKNVSQTTTSETH